MWAFRPSCARASSRTSTKIDADIAVLGVPFDEGSPFLPGSRMAPRALREHSLRFGKRGYYDPETKREYLVDEMTNGRIVDCGDVDIHPANAPRTFQNITAAVKAILASGAMPVVLGGDHSITYPIFRALEEPVHVLHFDAHTDYAPFENDLELTNGHAFRHVAGMKTALSLTQIGIRSLRHTPEMVRGVEEDGNRVIPMGEFRALGPPASRSCCRRIPRSMSASMSMRSTCRWCRAASPPSRTA